MNTYVSTPNTGRDGAIHVVAGVLRNNVGEILITQRLPHAHQGGKWEFPGGKLEPNEEPGQALRRELEEELGIHVQSIEPRIQIRHDYQDKRVFLDVYDVTSYNGQPRGRENQALRWLKLTELDQFEYPAANYPVIVSLKLPETYVITGLSLLGEDLFFRQLDVLLESGIRLFQFREPSLSPERYLRTARRFIERAHRFDAKVLLNTGRLTDVNETAADGLHLNSRQLLSCRKRPLPAEYLVAASCHNEEELKQAESLRIDFVVLSPVQKTGSHPKSPVLGWDRFEQLVGPCCLPVYALGGMSLDDRLLARRHGAQGVAVLSAAWLPGETESAC